MTRYAIMLFQEAYPEQIYIAKEKIEGTKEKVCAAFWLLNEDKSPHMLLFDGIFQNEKEIDETIEHILNIKL